MLNGLLWVFTNPGKLCVFRFVCNCATTPSIPNIELSWTSSFLSSWIPSWSLTVFAHFHKDFDMRNKLMSCRVISLHPFPTKISSCRAEKSLNFTSTKPESLSLGIAVSRRVFHLFESHTSKFRFVLVEGSSWVLQSLDSRFFDRFCTPHLQVLGKSEQLVPLPDLAVRCKEQYACSSCS